MLTLLLWVGLLLGAFMLYCHYAYSKFSRYGVKNQKPWPLIGNMAPTLLRKEHFTESIINLYNAFPGERFVGRYEFFTPVLMIYDQDLIRKITIKDFEHFIDHRSIFHEVDSFFARTLTSLKGQEWKDMRSTLSPAFTSSKIRLMVPFMVEVGDQMIASIKEKIRKSGVDYIDLECKDLTSRYANDVIASCAFGLKVDSQADENNEFFAMGRESTKFGFRKTIVFFIMISLPMVAKMFKLDFISKEANNFYRNLVLDTMADREQRNIIRHDMIHLLMEAKKGTLSHENVKNDDTAGFATVEESSVGTRKVNRVWSDKDLIAQAVMFLVAGFDTVSTAAIFLFYELAINPDVQDKLAKEIQEHDVKNGGKFDLKSIQEMHYLDMVVSETLRKWPPAVALDRLCVKDYNLGKPNDGAAQDYVIRKGQNVQIPAMAFHRDPKFFSDPDKFDPERFSQENKHKINPNAYMPFGFGPRNCIGSRFALCELKVMVYQVLQHMEVSPCEKTCIPVELTLESFNFEMKGGNWLRFRVRS